MQVDGSDARLHAPSKQDGKRTFYSFRTRSAVHVYKAIKTMVLNKNQPAIGSSSGGIRKRCVATPDGSGFRKRFHPMAAAASTMASLLQTRVGVARRRKNNNQLISYKTTSDGTASVDGGVVALRAAVTMLLGRRCGDGCAVVPLVELLCGLFWTVGCCCCCCCCCCS